MPVTAQQIRHIATLARLNPSHSEVTLLAAELSAIVDYVANLQQVSGEQGLGDRPAGLNVRAERDDIIRPSLAAGEALQNAPQREGDYFIVPKVIG